MQILVRAMRDAPVRCWHQHTSSVDIRKRNNDIVTRRLLVNNVLKPSSWRISDYGWLSEESVDDARRLHGKTCKSGS